VKNILMQQDACIQYYDTWNLISSSTIYYGLITCYCLQLFLPLRTDVSRTGRIWNKEALKTYCGPYFYPWLPISPKLVFINLKKSHKLSLN
jgi:hypothetical protein